MKKRLILLALLLVCLLGCATNQTVEHKSLDFYYQKASAALGAELGILGIEKWGYQGETPTFETILQAYLEGPQGDEFVSPFPRGLEIEYVALENNLLTIQFNSVYDTVSGYDKTIMDGCLLNTLTQFSDVSSVVLETQQSKNTQDFTSQVRLVTDYILKDTGIEPTETVLRLYFSDANGRYLVSKDVTLTLENQESIPATIIERLIDGPTESGQYAVIPEGTELLDIEVDDKGLCTVNFSSEFVFNKPTTELMERMTIFAVVNALTELKTVNEVLFLTDGEPIGQYVYLDLSEPLVRDDNIMTVVRTDQGETDGTIYVKGPTGNLAAIPVGLAVGDDSMAPERLMIKLLQFTDSNGYDNPLPTGLAIQQIWLGQGICYVDFNSNFLQCAGDLEAETNAVHCVVETLTSLTGVEGVSISVNGINEGFLYVNLQQILTRESSWFA